MQTFRTEGNYRSADRLSAAELRAAMASREILQSTALAFDTARQLRFEFGRLRTRLIRSRCVIWRPSRYRISTPRCWVAG